MEKIHITLELFFEIKNAELYGGEGTTGYAQLISNLRMESMKDFDLQEYAKTNIEGFAKACKIEVEDVQIIPREEYKENTEEGEP